jgi:hypothetical protein
MSVAAARHFFRRWGPAAAVPFGALFWGACLAIAAAAGGGWPSWPSAAVAGGCALATVGYAVYLAVFRQDLRRAPGPESAAPPPTRRCPSCGLEIGSHLARCPVCGAEQAEE